MSTRRNWATINYQRPGTSAAPPSKFYAPLPEVLPVESPEEAARKEQKAGWLRGIMDACEDEVANG